MLSLCQVEWCAAEEMRPVKDLVHLRLLDLSHSSYGRRQQDDGK